MKNVTLVEHPLIVHKLSHLRAKDTETKRFRELVAELATLLCYEATKDLELEDVVIETPLESMTTQVIKGKKVAVVPILRAGLGMVEGVTDLLPAARVGVVGIYRDHDSLEPVQYYAKLPGKLDERMSLVLDPMLATGGSASPRHHAAQGAGGQEHQAALAGRRPRGHRGGARASPRGAHLRGRRRPGTQRYRLHPAWTGRRRRPPVRHALNPADGRTETTRG